MPNLLNLKEENRLVKLYNQGMPWDELAIQFGKPQASLNSLIGRLRKSRKDVASIQERNRMVKFYISGGTVTHTTTLSTPDIKDEAPLDKQAPTVLLEGFNAEATIKQGDLTIGYLKWELTELVPAGQTFIRLIRLSTGREPVSEPVNSDPYKDNPYRKAPIV